MRVVIFVSCLLAAVSANFQSYDYAYGGYPPYPQPPQQYYPQPPQQHYPPTEESNPAEPIEEDTNTEFQPQPTFGPRNLHQNTFHKHANPGYFPSHGARRQSFHHNMRHTQRSAPHVTHKPKKPSTRYVPVVVKKKTKKNRTILSTYRGFYIPNGTQMFGKFADLKSCQKACELTPTCFAADFNPWVKKCYAHGNATACDSMKTHKQITHFKKTVCTVTNTPRGLVTLGIQIFKGVKVHDIKDLASCIKKCTTLGGGIAAKGSAASIGATPQICFGVDFDFSSHSCYLHIRTTTSYKTLCPMADDPITTSTQSFPKATSVNILICPLVMA